MLEGLDAVLNRIDMLQKQFRRLEGGDDSFSKALAEKQGSEQEIEIANKKDALKLSLDPQMALFDDQTLSATRLDPARRLQEALQKNPELEFNPLRNSQIPATAYGDNLYDDYITQAARANKLPFALIKAVVNQESQFNPRAVSPVGAQGLMQIMPETGRLLGLENPFNPRENIMAGSAYLKEMVNRYQGNIALALAAYNAGPGAVDAAGGVPNFSETKDYVQKVLSFYGRYS